MGRHPSEPRQTKNGTFECWHPQLKRKVNLGTTDYARALELQKGFYNVVPEAKPVTETVSIPILAPSPNGGGTATMINLDDENEKPTEVKSGIELLSTWAKTTQESNQENKPTETVQVPTSITEKIFGPSSVTSVSTGPTPGTLVKPKRGLTPQQSAKIAGGLKKMAVNTNIVIMGAAIQMFGVIPAPLDKEEIELLQLGWEMWLDELFNKAKLKPVYLVIIGNVMIAISMYASGTKKPKAEKKTVQGAPGHEVPVDKVPVPDNLKLVSPPRPPGKG